VHYGYTNWLGDTARDDEALANYLLAAKRARGPNLEENWSLGWVEPSTRIPGASIHNGLLGLACGATGLTVYTACATDQWDAHLDLDGVTRPYGESAPVDASGKPGAAYPRLRTLTHFLAGQGTDLVGSRGLPGPIVGTHLEFRRGTDDTLFVFLFNRSPTPRQVRTPVGDTSLVADLGPYGCAVVRLTDDRMTACYVHSDLSTHLRYGHDLITSSQPCDLSVLGGAADPVRHTGGPGTRITVPCSREA
jgi:hypothetical protein